MPLYENRCQKCGHEFEVIQRPDDLPPPCPKCQEETKRLISRTSFILNGGGWAKDGY